MLLLELMQGREAAASAPCLQRVSMGREIMDCLLPTGLLVQVPIGKVGLGVGRG